MTIHGANGDPGGTMKRRRERDRPKADPEGLCNPNKRVLLSYESDEEGRSPISAAPRMADDTLDQVVQAAGSAQTVLSAESPQLGKGSVKEEGASSVATAVAVEEKNNTVTAKDDSARTRGVRRHDTTGQWAALGSLSYQCDEGEEEDDEEEYNTEDEEAMSYLRAVRSERQSMPMVLRAPSAQSHQDIYESGVGDTRGFFEDGAYVAAANQGPQLPQDLNDDIAPQEAFTMALRERFLKQRARMHLPPDSQALQSLQDEHLISFPAKSDEAYKDWSRHINTAVPLTAQIQSMQQSDALRLLGLIQERFIRREAHIAGNIAAWIWSLLARLDDVGAMGNDEVSAVREIAKKAIIVQLSFDNPDAAEQLEIAAAEERSGAQSPSQQPGLAGQEISASADANPSAGKTEAMHSGTDSSTEQVQNSLATLDMIIVLVSEVFRQRDLLEFRRSWPSPSAS